jgi:hypothetical protein
VEEKVGGEKQISVHTACISHCVAVLMRGSVLHTYTPAHARPCH